jgi:hypothetical protein
VTIKDKQLIQQLVTTPMPTIVHVIANLSTYVPKHFDYQPLDGGQLGDSPGRSSPKGDLPKKPPFNPPIGSFGWPTPNLHMFIPPWYQPPIM